MYYKKLEINNFESIQNVISRYFIDFASKDISPDKPFYNYSSEDQLKKIKNDIPIFFEVIEKELKSEILNLSYLYYDHLRSYCPIHTDVKDLSIKQRIKLNWPILNCQFGETIFYSLKDDANPIVHNTFNEHLPNKVITSIHYSKDDCVETDKFILNQPTLIDVRPPHAVKFLKNNFPRILLSMRLSNEEELTQKFFVSHKTSPGTR
jgi:hypothetical protein